MPLTSALRLIVIGHKAILLPLRFRAKSKWGVAASWLRHSGVALYELSHEPFADVCRAPVPDAKPANPKKATFHRNALQFAKMNPDKLFDYLDGRLSPKDRAVLEEQLMSDKQLQREFAVARQIHSGMRGDSQEVVLSAPPDVSEQGRKMALRIGVAFMVLLFVNVGIGLWFIFQHESKNPNRPLLEAQMREQIAKSIERAAPLTPAPNALGVTEITIQAESGKLDAVADKVVATISRLGGSATKGVPDAGHLSILVDLPASRESDFRAAIQSIAGEEKPESSSPTTAQEPGSSPPAKDQKASFVVQVVEAPSKQQ